MKIGMLTGLWYVASQASVFEAIERAAALGFHFVDLHGVFHAGPAHLSDDDRLRLRPELDRLGLEARNYVLHPRHNIASATPAEWDEDLAYMCQGIDWAVGWGVRQVMLNAGQWRPMEGRAAAWSRAVQFLQSVCEYAERRGVFILQEPEPYVWFLVDDLAAAQQLALDVARPNFRLLVDLGHMGLAREGAAELEAVADSILHAHFSDHKQNQHTNQIIGTGAVPLGELVRALERLEIDERVRRSGFEELVVSFELGAPGDTIHDPDEWVRQSVGAVLPMSTHLSLSRS